MLACRPCSPVWARRPRVSRNRYRAALCAPAYKLPFVGKTQHAVLGRELRREAVERARELEDREGRLIELGVAARAADDGAVERAVGVDADFEDRARGPERRAGGGREVERADALDLAPPGVEIGRERAGAGVGRDPQLIALRPRELGGPRLVGRSRLRDRRLVDEQRPVALRAAAAEVCEIAHVAHPRGG